MGMGELGQTGPTEIFKEGSCPSGGASMGVQEE